MSEETLAGSLAPKLALLRAVAEEGNLTRAAATVGIPQPTASRWLTMVSTELGTPVVVPDGRGIRLSRAGAYLAEAAGRALAVVAAGVRQAVDEGDPERGHVVLAFMHTLGEHLLPGLLRTFRREHPHVRFSLLQGPHEELLDHVRSGRADLAFTAPLPGPGEFAAITLEEQQLVVTVPTEHRLAHRTRMRMTDLAREPSVGMKPGYGLRQITDELAEAAGFLPTLAFEGDDVDTLRGLVAAGLGVAVLPAAEPKPRPGTVEIPLRPKATRHIGLIWAADPALAPAALAFRDFVSSGA
ncbi:LysR family transcriptional regulator [Mycobacterium sp.]|uniref:LysR family transcriptional regulator n=1 Tax=Mycobacterium sp. TaxID=1785 RepID=UPI002D3F9E10|nr:LysR substrate-binding domain-containing protein [Mycobacterium sp.]HZA11024.1 LysR substrate-binding domain-containing protein [Mycobacterium sp.]